MGPTAMHPPALDALLDLVAPAPAPQSALAADLWRLYELAQDHADALTEEGERAREAYEASRPRSYSRNRYDSEGCDELRAEAAYYERAADAAQGLADAAFVVAEIVGGEA